MKKREFDINDLSDGISNMPRRLTSREWLADNLFFYMQLVSRLSFYCGRHSRLCSVELVGLRYVCCGLLCFWHIGSP